MVFAKVAKLRVINYIKMYKIVEYYDLQYTDCSYVGGSFEEKLLKFNIYFFKGLYIAHLSDNLESGKRNILLC